MKPSAGSSSERSLGKVNRPSSFTTVSNRQMKAYDGLDLLSKDSKQLKPVRRGRLTLTIGRRFESYLARQSEFPEKFNLAIPEVRFGGQ